MNTYIANLNKKILREIVNNTQECEPSPGRIDKNAKQLRTMSNLLGMKIEIKKTKRPTYNEIQSCLDYLIKEDLITIIQINGRNRIMATPKAKEAIQQEKDGKDPFTFFLRSLSWLAVSPLCVMLHTIRLAIIRSSGNVTFMYSPAKRTLCILLPSSIID